MYATIIRCDMQAIASAQTRGQMGRTLATIIGALPGFIAFIALDEADETGTLIALCLVEDLTSLAEARRAMARWHMDTSDICGAALSEISAGAVIAQRGL